MNPNDRTNFDPDHDRWVSHGGAERVLRRHSLQQLEVWSEEGDRKYFTLPLDSTTETIDNAIRTFRLGYFLGHTVGVKQGLEQSNEKFRQEFSAIGLKL